jgi:tetratricopeptide (TPR) repeat protein
MLRRVDERLAEKPAAQGGKASTEKLYRLGVKQLAEGKAALGRRSLEQAAHEDPFSPRIQFALGGALQAVGDTYRAISAYERAVELRPKLYPALKALASLYLDKGFRQKAAETFERASACAPDPHEREEMRAALQRLS